MRTIEFKNNVSIKETAAVAGVKEGRGPLKIALIWFWTTITTAKNHGKKQKAKFSMRQ